MRGDQFCGDIKVPQRYNFDQFAGRRCEYWRCRDAVWRRTRHGDLSTVCLELAGTGQQVLVLHVILGRDFPGFQTDSELDIYN